MPHNNIKIESIDRSLRLKDKEGGSVGETLAVGYAFLSTLLHHADHNLPCVIDSPSGPIDLGVRPEIGKLIPKIGDQFIAFVISSERQNFVPPLIQNSDKPIGFITLFRKGNSKMEASVKGLENIKETIDGILVNGKNYFENFQFDQE
jgi:hypothetical protein